MIRKYTKMISILYVMACLILLAGGGRSYAMELNEIEREGKEESHQRAAEYEMNMILEMLLKRMSIVNGMKRDGRKGME